MSRTKRTTVKLQCMRKPDDNRDRQHLLRCPNMLSSSQIDAVCDLRGKRFAKKLWNSKRRVKSKNIVREELKHI